MSDNDFQFKQLRDSELAAPFNDFKISDIMYSAANNDYWQNKKALWAVISSACNDAAREYYIKLNTFIRNIADIDTCNIHALKSIAQSIDGEHLTNYISENYPQSLLDLINLFSIPKNILLNKNILNLSSTLSIAGSIDFRNIQLTPNNYYIELLSDIYTHLEEIKNILIVNKFNYTEPKNDSEQEDQKLKYDLYSIITDEPPFGVRIGY